MRYYDDYLMHYGIKGQRWGIRRFQKLNGSLTDAGKARYRNADIAPNSNYGVPYVVPSTGDSTKNEEIKQAERDLVSNLNRELHILEGWMAESSKRHLDRKEYNMVRDILSDMISLYADWAYEFNIKSKAGRDLIERGQKRVATIERNMQIENDTYSGNSKIKESSNWKTGADMIRKDFSDNWKAGAKDIRNTVKDINKTVKKNAVSTATKAKNLGEEFVDNWTTGVKDIFGSKKKKKKSK